MGPVSGSVLGARPGLGVLGPRGNQAQKTTLGPQRGLTAHRMTKDKTDLAQTFQHPRWFAGVVLMAFVGAGGCGVVLGLDTSESSASDPIPEGRVAGDAEEAWPGHQPEPKPLTPEQLARGCAVMADCWSETGANRLLDVELCILAAAFSIERSIPWSGYALLLASRGHGYSNERTEVALRCALENAQDCREVDGCLTERTDLILCEEDGCRSKVPFAVSCDGDVATLRHGLKTVARDCALAAAVCTELSETGCTDRPFTACPVELGTPDWCDGNVLLGCDSYGQLTYHDCSRLGGECTESANSAASCAYPGLADPLCQRLPEQSGDARCEGEQLVACVRGTRVRVPAARFCGNVE